MVTFFDEAVDLEDGHAAFRRKLHTVLDREFRSPTTQSLTSTEPRVLSATKPRTIGGAHFGQWVDGSLMICFARVVSAADVTSLFGRLRLMKPWDPRNLKVSFVPEQVGCARASHPRPSRQPLSAKRRRD